MFKSDNYRERITTSSGEVMGGFDTPPEVGPQRRVRVEVNRALRNRGRKFSYFLSNLSNYIRFFSSFDV
ncbi:hypothetical protein DPMN_156278 [Dreissena polymorpha]|uniref:Uncharacterized protein n=1 Tax=Dreissena polymorpha TaxID=45954 RepID=A0A9D4FPJ0_DREPO|nr:hypothetical protein DPMN_156278 [Dreissena polymorpha]